MVGWGVSWLETEGEKRRETYEHIDIMTTTMIRMVTMTIEQLLFKGKWDLAPFRVFLSTVFTSNSITVN